MNCFISPKFELGPETLCCAVSFLTQVKRKGYDGPIRFYELIYDRFSPYYQKIIIHSCEVIDYLSPHHPEAKKVQEIWNRLAECRNPHELWKVKEDLERWVDQYKTKDSIPAEVVSYFQDTSLVLFVDEVKELPPNAYPASKCEELVNYVHRLKKHVHICGDKQFQERVMSIFYQAIAHPPGRELVESIQTAFTIKPYDSNEFLGQNMIGLSEKQYVNFYQGVMQKHSLWTSIDIPLMHEVLHLIHSGQNLSHQRYDPSTTFGDLWDTEEEVRTIKGPGLCENSFDSAYGLPLRCGHAAGNSPLHDPTFMLNRALEFEIFGDFDWIIQLIDEDTLKMLYTHHLQCLQNSSVFSKIIDLLHSNDHENSRAHASQIIERDLFKHYVLLERMNVHLHSIDFFCYETLD